MAMKVFKGNAKLYLEAGLAKPSATVGQAIGPLALNMADVCRQFNDRTQQYKSGTKLRVFVTAYEDRTYDLRIKGPPTVHLLKGAAKIEKGANNPGKEIAGEVDARQIYEIARLKLREEGMESHSLKGMSHTVAATARSMGLKVVLS